MIQACQLRAHSSNQTPLTSTDYACSFQADRTTQIVQQRHAFPPQNPEVDA